MRRTVPLLVVALALTLSACGEPDSSGRSGGSSAYEGTWVLIEGRGPDGEIPLIDGYRITLIIDGATVGGSAACNSYGGDARIDDGSFDMVGAGMTDMACRRDVMESESAYMHSLEVVDTIALDGRFLMLAGPDSELRFEPAPPVPTAALVGTTWDLETLFEGRGDDGIASSAQPARLLLNEDGTFTGTTGCRDLEGEWVEAGDQIVFTTLSTEGGCPKELREQDGHVVEVLGDGFTAQIDGDRLTLWSSGDLGLGYRAES